MEFTFEDLDELFRLMHGEDEPLHPDEDPEFLELPGGRQKRRLPNADWQ